MDNESLPPIPTPAGQRWREFRIRALPLLVFVCILAALFLTWSTYIQPVSIVGLVETNVVNVLTTQPGLLNDLVLNRFDEVTKGQIIGTVAPFDEEQINAELAAIASLAKVVEAREEVTEWGKENNALMVRLNLFAQERLVDVARIGYEQASNVVARDLELMKPPNPVVTKATYDADVAKRDALKSQWDNGIRLVEEWTKEVANMGPSATNVFEKLDKALKADILAQQEQLRQLQKPVVLRAPITGKVSAVLHHAGERVVAGAPILTITSAQAPRIVAYVRQPLNFHPKVGDMVSVRTRNTRRKSGDAQIVKVGTQLENVNPMLLPLAKAVPEMGLPILLTLPPELELLPGEIVDIKVLKN